MQSRIINKVVFSKNFLLKKFFINCLIIIWIKNRLNIKKCFFEKWVKKWNFSKKYDFKFVHFSIQVEHLSIPMNFWSNLKLLNNTSGGLILCIFDVIASNMNIRRTINIHLFLNFFIFWFICINIWSIFQKVGFKRGVSNFSSKSAIFYFAQCILCKVRHIF